MADHPSKDELRSALGAAAAAHHDYEQKYLDGVRDQQWSGWYAAFVLGRVGDFVSPTRLTRWLETAPGEGDWAESAAGYVLEHLHTDG